MPLPLASGSAEASATVELFGLRFQTADAATVVAAVAAGSGDGPRMIVTANVDHIVQLGENADFRGAYARAAARTLDGMPLVWLARRASHRPVHRVTGHDLLACILADPPDFAGRIFFVASRQDAADALSVRLQAGGLPAGSVTSVVPPFGFEADPDYSHALIERIRAHNTTLLVMAVGAPKSEIWVDRHRAHLGDPVVFCVGDALNVAAGCMSRAPGVLQRLGLEWVFRFLQAPRRLFRRYFIKSWRFVGIVARDRVARWGG
ncbi:WecB/TagA/CpsF family glycosyltransferase [Methylobacterium mesophilicum SR1.6/6]|uniref:WecB/TagA/CpsF family glycosyltransferase n=1 Tax=Methylobacterium mesophilicum SR1.6/6 TaxID=908290 RepID=A0A6B9FN82_9HYPH|nr:WecB/TagA/CpsF family glycosyltransferase [Methylobacterium mesophilicum]QGY02644.1 WecB/TagA/CpsF family glycosyltransferase [Methylobacterium mesophilicum SR1.6/6]